MRALGQDCCCYREWTAKACKQEGAIFVRACGTVVDGRMVQVPGIYGIGDTHDTQEGAAVLATKVVRNDSEIEK